MKIIVDEFMEHLKARQASSNTLASYERDIQQFTNYFDKKDKKIFDLKSEDMQEYIDYLKSCNKSTSTISRTNASIKAFYKFLLSKKFVEENIALNISVPKVDKKDPAILTKQEIEKLLEQPDLKDLKGQRDRTMLEILYATGIRVTELTSLVVDDVNIQGRYIKVKKKNKERQIPIGAYATKILSGYIDNIRPLLIKSEDEKSLFINTNGQKMTRQGFWKILKQYKEEAHIDKELTPHTIRHSFAIHMLEEGVGVKKVQEMLGHTDVASTLIYTHMLENNPKDDNIL